MDHLWTPWRYAYVTGADKHTSDGVRRRPGVPDALTAWPGDLHCVFCNMIAAVDFAQASGTPRDQAEAAAGILERGPTCFLVLNSYPYNSGHLMVVPYQHADSLAGLPLPTTLELMRQARRAELALRSVYRPLA